MVYLGVLFDPLSVRAACGDLLLDGPVVLEPAVHEVARDHLPGTQAAFAHNLKPSNQIIFAEAFPQQQEEKGGQIDTTRQGVTDLYPCRTKCRGTVNSHEKTCSQLLAHVVLI